ncbi:Structural maintenance of chromosomes protein 6 [Psilocybe cubensis]|uniref:Structural maintenance of chromosomes protein 6 n=1 Tax=Psilocybe cubensis TaxID=181762 RepID=A0ACB8GZ08_PSICU|nr:Structural maintenance of chromosomes protein 6 [Psilocybe cubensis]KAH9480811.1 Structural maintenance of chromosomes protein 6 [Psilocybe cubensis]
MPKRHNYGQSDDEEEDTRTSKRVRTAGSSDEEQEASQPPRARASRTDKGKGKARAWNKRDVNAHGSMSEDEIDEEAHEEEFDRIHGPALLRRLANRPQNKLGSIAEHGVIEYVEMTQFMCHKYLTFHFGPQINFIIGHNGSGKSAVLSAITVALGGKSSSTGRGSGLKSFIREGQSTAEVTIHIKNQGEEAYKPEIYGKTISITRRFNKDGGSSWKIKGKDAKKTYSTKKDELDAICDHMNIQVDNPMNVLTQDAARQFLSASKPEDKYKFFLRGTQLEQLSQEYELCWANIHQTDKLLETKGEAIPELLERKIAAEARWKEADQARQQRVLIEELNKELAWAHVAVKEAEMVQKLNEHAKAERRLPKIEEAVQEAKAEFDKASEKVSILEAQMSTSDTEKQLNDKKLAIHEEMKENKVKLMDINKDLKQMNQTVEALNKTIEGIEKAQKNEEAKMAINTQEKREQTQAKIVETKAAIAGFEARLNELSIKKRDIESEAEKIKSEGLQWDEKMKEYMGLVKENEGYIEAAKKREHDVYIPYGKNMKQLLDTIRKHKWHGDMPLGPLGLHVKAKDPKTWGDILRAQLGRLLITFGVTDHKDRPALKRMLVQSGNPYHEIIVFQKDLFDYSTGEPPERYLTVLRALEVDDPYVLRLLINQAHIESLLLAHTRKEGEELLKTLRGGMAWTNDKMVVRVFPVYYPREGGVSSSRINMKPMNGAMSQLLTGRNAAEDIRFYLEKKEQAQQDYTSASTTVDNLKKEYHSKKREIDAIEREEKTTQHNLRQERARLNSLHQEANAELPAGLAGFAEAKLEAQSEKESMMLQIEGVMRNKMAVDTAQNKLQQELKNIRTTIAEFDQQRATIQRKMESAVEVRVKAQNAMLHYESKLAEGKKAVETALEAAQVVEEEFKAGSWTKEAETVAPERIATPRKPDAVKTHIASLKAALAERAKKTGASLETLAKQLTAAEESLKKAEAEIKAMKNLNAALTESMLVRSHRWDDFRMHVALRCKHIFQHHLSNRGYYGKLYFKHFSHQLDIRVITDDQMQTQGAARDKDPKSLSGGEKSFSTICLLLSLWECIGCPIRCLDEFDVFMDAVNRRISMKMMIDTANTSDRKQYILITPQDMANIKITPSVRVLRMSDPERGTNGTLPFTSANGD